MPAHSNFALQRVSNARELEADIRVKKHERSNAWIDRQTCSSKSVFLDMNMTRTSTVDIYSKASLPRDHRTTLFGYGCFLLSKIGENQMGRLSAAALFRGNRHWRLHAEA